MIAKIIIGVPDKMSGRPSALCWTFWAPVRHFSLLMAGKFSGHSYFPFWRFYVDWALLDKMSGKVYALCRTSAEVCWTCPACPAYFAITEQKTRWSSVSKDQRVDVTESGTWKGIDVGEGVILAAVNGIVYSSFTNSYTFFLWFDCSWK